MRRLTKLSLLIIPLLIVFILSTQQTSANNSSQDPPRHGATQPSANIDNDPRFNLVFSELDLSWLYQWGSQMYSNVNLESVPMLHWKDEPRGNPPGYTGPNDSFQRTKAWLTYYKQQLSSAERQNFYLTLFNECEIRSQCAKSPSDQADLFMNLIIPAIDQAWMNTESVPPKLIVGGSGSHPCDIEWMDAFVQELNARATTPALQQKLDDYIAGWHFHLYVGVGVRPQDNAPANWETLAFAGDKQWCWPPESGSLGIQTVATTRPDRVMSDLNGNMEWYRQYALQIRDWAVANAEPQDELWVTETGCFPVCAEIVWCHEYCTPELTAQQQEAYARKVAEFWNTEGRWLDRYAWYLNRGPEGQIDGAFWDPNTFELTPYGNGYKSAALQPATHGPCHYASTQASCEFDTRTFIEMNGEQVETITAYGRYFNYVDGYPWNTNGTYLKDVPHYSAICAHATNPIDCEFDSRTFLTLNGQTIESITAYGRYFNFTNGAAWGSNGSLLNSAHYGAICAYASSPQACTFDSRTFIEVNGQLIESITAYGRYFNFTNGVAWGSNGSLLSSAHYGAVCAYASSSQACTFDSRTFIEVNGQLVESITAYGRYFNFVNGQPWPSNGNLLASVYHYGD